jgi:hypothetical protein
MNYYHPNEDEGTLPFSKAVKWLSFLNFVFAALLLADFFLPESTRQEPVIRKTFFKEDNRFGSDDYELKLITPSQEILASAALFKDAPVNTLLTIQHTPIFHTIKSVIGKNQEGQLFIHEAEQAVYRGFGAFPVCLLLVSLIAIIYKKDDVTAYCSGILSMIVMLCLLIFFI